MFNKTNESNKALIEWVHERMPTLLNLPLYPTEFESLAILRGCFVRADSLETDSTRNLLVSHFMEVWGATKK